MTATNYDDDDIEYIVNKVEFIYLCKYYYIFSFFQVKIFITTEKI
jgi:hypothetical protein